MKKSITALAMTVAAVTLTACGGGGGGDGFNNNGTGEAAVGTNQLIADASAAFAALNTNFDNAETQGVAQNFAPTTGSATYTGELGFDIIGAVDPSNTSDVDASIVGDMTVTANFADRSVTGMVENIIYADTSSNVDGTTGDLTIAGTTASGSGITRQTVNGVQQDIATARLTGTLSVDQGGASDTNLEVNAVMAGQFGTENGTPTTDNPEILRGFIIGGASTAVPNAVTIPNGRFIGTTN